MRNILRIFLLVGIVSASECFAGYVPKNNGITCVNGKNRFTRAIYGTNSPFRFETSDFPEIGLYMPNMGGSVYFAIKNGDKTKWISKAENIEATYLEAGDMLFRTVRCWERVSSSWKCWPGPTPTEL